MHLSSSSLAQYFCSCERANLVFSRTAVLHPPALRRTHPATNGPSAQIYTYSSTPPLSLCLSESGSPSTFFWVVCSVSAVRLATHKTSRNAPRESRIPQQNFPQRGPDLGAASPSSMSQPPHLFPPRVPCCLLRAVEVEKGGGGGGRLRAPCSPRVAFLRCIERKRSETENMTIAIG